MQSAGSFRLTIFLKVQGIGIGSGLIPLKYPGLGTSEKSNFKKLPQVPGQFPWPGTDSRISI